MALLESNFVQLKTWVVSYFRPEAVQGLVGYLRFGLLEFLSEKSHPCCWNVDSLPDQKFPLVLFSHGLAGTYEMYTELCQHIASLGYCVVALEHQDGSAAYAHDGKKVIPYKKPNDEPYSRQKESAGRSNNDHKNSDNSNNNNDTNPMHLLRKVIQATDTQDLHLVGQSFGGATQMLATQQWTGKSRKKSMPRPKSLLVMDSWAFALTEDVVQQGLSKNDKTQINILSIISEDWEQNNVERLEVAEFLKSSEANTNNHILSMVAPDAIQ
ncbi:platelet-activating factor acetylhydrolase domain containing protein [Nitzschia inconspicua]|uniref:Platelet-activating factor acetylhydrolase domain containing protein n=1 Tax=Nitzschia inconspicua TaxID=303405 RepID=A0A9K3KDD4_9STRA|nr:platelet-activating factor acetylhydrolase domain containing protein [Nitzschia inconspicua]